MDILYHIYHISGEYLMSLICYDILGMLERGEVVTFEEQVGTHGGLGGPQTSPFVVYPRRFRGIDDKLRNPADMHRFLHSTLSS